MAKVEDVNRSVLAGQLLAFYDREGRPLPWRGERDLYRLWVSEVLLQQTGVSTVLAYYPRFLERFPDVWRLAEATEEAVLVVWQGLGYYQRARHLHRAAQIVVEQMAGRLPEDLASWLALPGIGPSTAAAILAIGRDQPHTILDGNVKRVLARLLALPHPLSSRLALDALWTFARSLTPSHRPGDYAQAIMDLGATVCTRSRPTCPRCPWQGACRAYRLGDVTAFPVTKPRPIKPHRVQWAVLVFDARQAVLLCQRPAQGLLGGLWEPPTFDWTVKDRLPLEPADIAQTIFQRLNLSTTPPVPLAPVQHTFTHFHLTVYPFVCHWEGEGPVNGEGCRKGRWVAREEWHTLPLATLHRKVLAVLGSSHHTPLTTLD